LKHYSRNLSDRNKDPEPKPNPNPNPNPKLTGRPTTGTGVDIRTTTGAEIEFLIELVEIGPGMYIILWSPREARAIWEFYFGNLEPRRMFVQVQNLLKFRTNLNIGSGSPALRTSFKTFRHTQN
jgi:hypothetical protein